MNMHEYRIGLSSESKVWREYPGRHRRHSTGGPCGGIMPVTSVGKKSYVFTTLRYGHFQKFCVVVQFVMEVGSFSFHPCWEKVHCSYHSHPEPRDALPLPNGFEGFV